jgi:hypothetical protein
MAIRVAEFVGDPSAGEVVVAGRRPHFYSYNTVTGTTDKIPGASPSPSLLLPLLTLSLTRPPAKEPPLSRTHGGLSSGLVRLSRLHRHRWALWLRPPAVEQTQDLGDRREDVLRPAPHSPLLVGREHALWSSWGRQHLSLGHPHVWRRQSPHEVVTPNSARLTSPPSLPSLSFRHDEGSYISSLATNRFHSSSASSSESSSSFQKFLAVGGESGVVSVYDLLSPPTAPATGPIKVKDVMNLTTKVSTMALHPSGQLLAVGSDQKKDQLRMVHLPSCSVFGNWPTARTPLGKVRCVDFSQGETLLPRTPHPPSFLRWALSGSGRPPRQGPSLPDRVDREELCSACDGSWGRCVDGGGASS